MCALLLFASLRSFLGFRSSKLRVGSSCQWPRATGTWPRSQVHPVARGGTIAPPERRERVIFFRAFFYRPPEGQTSHGLKPRSSIGRWTLLARCDAETSYRTSTGWAAHRRCATPFRCGKNMAALLRDQEDANRPARWSHGVIHMLRNGFERLQVSNLRNHETPQERARSRRGKARGDAMLNARKHGKRGWHLKKT